MGFGTLVLRGAVFGFAGMSLYLLLSYDPKALQQAADTVFSFESNPEQRLYSLVGVIVTFLTILIYIAESSIGEQKHPMVRL